MNQVIYTLPNDLPEPVDDDAGSHLMGSDFPPVCLMSTDSQVVCLAEVSHTQRVVLYCYPLTGRPGRDLPDAWLEIPGAAGCTPQSCSFRDHHQELRNLNARVFGLSTQTTDYQQEAAQRLHLPFALLSDAELILTQQLNLPTFEAGGNVLLKRLTMVVWHRRIVKVFYPVFPPDKNAQEVIDWLADNPHQSEP